MRTILLPALVVIAGLTSGVPDRVRAFERNHDEWIFPGEYESHEAMWMLWPTYENKAGFPVDRRRERHDRARCSGHTRCEPRGAGRRRTRPPRASVLTGQGRAARSRPLLSHPARRPLGPRHGTAVHRATELGDLRVTDWNFNYWGYEEPGQPDSSLFDEPFDRDAAALIGVPVLDARPGTDRRAHGSRGGQRHAQRARHDDRRRIGRHAAKSRAGTGSAEDRPLVTDYSAAEHVRAESRTGRPASALVEARVSPHARRRRSSSGFRRASSRTTERSEARSATHIRVPSRFDGVDIPHAGVYTMFTTNGHPDEYLRFVVARSRWCSRRRTSRRDRRSGRRLDALIRWLEEQNQRAARTRLTTSSPGRRRSRVSPSRSSACRLPVLDARRAPAGRRHLRLLHRLTTAGKTDRRRRSVMLMVWPASYVNYVPTNDLVLVSKLLEARSSAAR